MKNKIMRPLLSLAIMSMTDVLNLSAQTSRPAPPTMLRIQFSQSQSMPVQPGPPPSTPPELVSPDTAQPELPALHRYPVFTNRPPVFTNRPPVFTNHPVKFSLGIIQTSKNHL
jgi:hypothetical protein